jgi:hypothetical protein
VIPHSALLDAAVRESTTLSVTVDIMRGNTVVIPDVDVVAGSISSDRTSKTRLSADVQLVYPDWKDDDISVNVHRFRIKRGFTSVGITEELVLGTFRIDERARNDNGLLALKGSGLETYIIDARFLSPRTPPYGQSTINTIRSLILEVLPDVTVVNEATTDTQVLMTAPWKRDRWDDAIEPLMESINVEVFVDYRGAFVIRDLPNLATGVPVYRINEGENGVLVSRSTKQTRDRVYNAFVASGSSTDPNVVPVFAVAMDSDPFSETYFYGDFGQVPRFYVNQNFTTTAQCQATADRGLADALAANKSLQFTTAPLHFLETGDLVQVMLADGSEEVHLVNTLSGGLSVDGGLQAETLSTKNIATGEFTDV